jgi:stage V sporulation protein D (sporulation-specific penicillin-binding protein)
VKCVLAKRSVEMKRKGFILFFVFLVAFVLLIGQLTYIVLVEGKYYDLAVLQNAAKREESIKLNDKRGLIYDRNGIVLADSVSTYDLIFDAKLLDELDASTQDKTINFLSKELKFSEVELRTILEEQRSSHYVILGKNYSYSEFKEVKAAIDGYLVKGLFYREGYTRIYPYPKLASDVIGFVDADLNGRIGIESVYNDYLKGTSGRIYGAVDSDKKLEVKEINAVNGANIMLTLDYSVQKHINDAIANYFETDQATRIHVIVMDPQNGEILGMANYPDYSLEQPYDVESFKTLKQFENKSDTDILNLLWGNENVNGSYEPGSTFKPFVVAAALEENKVNEEDRYHCEGSLKVGNYRISCWEPRGHGEQTIEEALANSCNVALMEIGETIGRDIFYDYQRMFGFGAQTGIDLTGETSARVNVYERDELNIVELATSSFGQGFNLTPIQLINGFSALINGGYLYEPHLMKKIYTEEQIVTSYEPKLYRQVISEDVSHLLRQILGNVVNEGTGKKASIAGYQIGGKTGTAETSARDDSSYIVSFIGFAPVENPQVITLVVVEEPVGIKVNSRFAAKIFVDVMEDVMPYLNIFKEETEVLEELENE